MNLNCFLHQNHKQRAAWTLANGKFLLMRESGAFTICLYSVDTYFAEVWYRKTDNEMQLVRGFRSTGLLSPYLAMIDLTGLVATI